MFYMNKFDFDFNMKNQQQIHIHFYRFLNRNSYLKWDDIYIVWFPSGS